ncbi:uncharacterized protein HMPREF1541_04109 [Cyphellophora europaea CBS 101466]|uniref:G-protein coupled receptors family 1 profile domain-containing protein n=1 Tax=Cyphellophora europaea (strain CBS 101466) TaxID=1220924 RepID=W2S292_CYPE1|nr:uncharacterized protein HMPREF1541_04109 [Cyphellophora europaea CBS 101466]ETN42168.1 hypothetical protein HMPREF1541_04109 [Cyphellophora europaea CBS 101466]
MSNTGALQERGLNAKENPQSPFTPSQNRAILLTGLSCACVSLVVVIVALRWFVLMKRIFRHRLILYLVASDTFKAIWYFVFAVVSTSRGPVSSGSNFCQASGYLLLLAVEASDFAILLIAVHTMLCIFGPSNKSGEAGLYPYRNWILPFWLGPPLLFASLAFINGSNAYVTSGTFCFLPKRPFWYRLALGWIPRYLIIITILCMYTIIYIYVHVKFQGFKNLQAGDSSTDSASASRRATESMPMITPGSQNPSEPEPLPTVASPSPAKVQSERAVRVHPYDSNGNGATNATPVLGHNAPWDSMMFLTQYSLDSTQRKSTAGGNFAGTSSPEQANRSERTSNNTSASNDPSVEGRKQSEAPTICTSFTGQTASSPATCDNDAKGAAGTRDHLRETRAAIQRQLRFLFIYPIIYILMWVFPFANHAILYDDHYILHPPFWLTIVSTCSVALQAAVNAIVFSWREKPWRRIKEDSRLSLSFRFRKSASSPEDEVRQEPAAPRVDNSPLWWEAEGRKRQDSVWLGTDVVEQVPSRRLQRTNTLMSIDEQASTEA